MSCAKERRDYASAQMKESRRDSVENLLEKYRGVFEEIGDVIIEYFNPSDDFDDCSCDECCECHEHYDPIEERISSRALDSIEEVVSRWSEDPNYSSDTAMDCIANVLESLGR